MNTEFNIIKSQHEKTMLDMEKMTQSIVIPLRSTRNSKKIRIPTGESQTQLRPCTRQGMLVTF